jgi:hypothetical protein
VWALRDTAQLTAPPTASTVFRLFKTVISSEVYGVPPDALQKRGPLPLGSQVDPNVFEMVATNEHRMQAVMYANGRLWSAVTTGLTSPGEDYKAGIAWFSIEVEADRSKLEAHIEEQGYVAARNASVFFPAIAVNSAGAVAMGFSLSGPSYFPSAAYSRLGGDGFGPIRISGAGIGSEDGFSGYPDAVSVPPPCEDAGNGQLLCEARWGDYGAAAIDDDGSIWLANEYIGPRPRTLLANWGTFLTRLKPNGN